MSSIGEIIIMLALIPNVLMILSGIALFILGLWVKHKTHCWTKYHLFFLASLVVTVVGIACILNIHFGSLK